MIEPGTKPLLAARVEGLVQRVQDGGFRNLPLFHRKQADVSATCCVGGAGTGPKLPGPIAPASPDPFEEGLRPGTALGPGAAAPRPHGVKACAADQFV